MTRPSPSEVVAGVRSVLKDVVAPELTSDHARQRLAEVRAVLAQVDWDDAGLQLAARAASRREALADLRAWWGEDAVAAGAFADASSAVDHALAPLPGATWAQLAEQDERCAAALVALVDPLADWAAAHPSDEVARALRARVRALLV